MLKLFFRVLGWVLFVALLSLKIDEYKWLSAQMRKLDWPKLPIVQIDIIVNLLVFFIAANTLLFLAVRYYRLRKKFGKSYSDNIITGISNIYYLLMGSAVFITALSLFGIDIFTLFASLSIVAAAIAIVAKEYISNIISGVIFTFSKEININDIIQVGGMKGKVLDITFSKFVLLNEDDDIIYVPNSVIFNSEVINYTNREIKKTSIDFEMDWKYIKTIPELEEDLIGSISEYHHLIQPDSYTLRIVDIKKESLFLKFQYILNEPDRDQELTIRKKMVRHVVQIIKNYQNNVKM